MQQVSTPEPMVSAPYFLGYYGEGGFGSHPAIFTPAELARVGWTKGPSSQAKTMFFYSDENAQRVWSHPSDGLTNFHIIQELPSVPDAVCCWLEDGFWRMKPVDLEQASAIVQESGGDTIYRDEPLFPRACELAAIKGDAEDLLIAAISFILTPKSGHVYWSDNPESTHGYWENGKAIPVSEL